MDNNDTPVDEGADAVNTEVEVDVTDLIDQVLADDIPADGNGDGVPSGLPGGVAIVATLDATKSYIGPNRGSRTALVFESRGADDTDSAVERFCRVAESFNRPGDSPAGTIKADVFTLEGDTLRSGYPVKVNEAFKRQPLTTDDGIDENEEQVVATGVTDIESALPNHVQFVRVNGRQ